MKYFPVFCLVFIQTAGSVFCSNTSSALIKNGVITGKNTYFNNLLNWKITKSDLSVHSVQKQEMSVYVNGKILGYAQHFH